MCEYDEFGMKALLTIPQWQAELVRSHVHVLYAQDTTISCECQWLGRDAKRSKTRSVHTTSNKKRNESEERETRGHSRETRAPPRETLSSYREPDGEAIAVPKLSRVCIADCTSYSSVRVSTSNLVSLRGALVSLLFCFYV